ncbi:uncharacterized protein LOC113849111 [Abrus precatorius]|uniref:Uncharacterized protein LOC113849111 n=1 Tax=Abrus precatorius TaxID=3816 RepID=A0A8B8JV93_ABRPR|nr:uncharacterized protein LOC113849111 [Abrus precatorius]
MGESTTCLVRSFSTPSDTSCVVQEGNPMRMLGESISFGRFITEGLDWEKWSAFSHKRYVEEAEKYSKPGSVAAKKAYFEAHYKKKAAERAAALIQEANSQANGTFDSKTLEGNCTDISTEMNSKADNVVIVNEQEDKETVNCQVVECADMNQYKCDSGQSDLVISNVEGTEDVPHPHVDTNLNMECSALVDNSNQFHHVEVHNSNLVDHHTVDREENSSKLSTETMAAKRPHSLDEGKVAVGVSLSSEIHNGSKGKKSDGDLVEKKRPNARSLRMSINLPSGTGEKCNKVAALSQSRNGLNNFSTSKKSVGGSVDKKRITAPSLYMSNNLPSGTRVTSKTATSAVKPRNGTNFAARSMKSIGDSVEKRPTLRSLNTHYMSINLASGLGETSKTTSAIEQNRIKKIHSHLPKDNPLALRTSTKASRGLLNQASASPLSQGRRTERLRNKSVSGGVTANAKLSPSVAVDCLTSSSTTKSNPRSATISSPFRFRSEERAVKRKEFLQRMDETKSKEEEKVQLQRTPKRKTEHDHHKKLRKSSGSTSKLNEDMPGGSQSPSNQIRKISHALPRSPKLVKKASSSTVHDKSLGNSWKPPMCTNNSKRTTEKVNRTRRQSVISLSNTATENASPNIQHWNMNLCFEEYAVKETEAT